MGPILLVLVLSALLIWASGCTSAGMVKLANDLAKDPATVNVAVQSPWGSLKVTRTNPGTNSLVTVTPDGTVTTERK